MAMTRESTFLPTIKCSQCGNQVEISMMGEHICNGSGSDLPPTFEAEEAPQESYGFQAAFKSWRKPGPLDTGAANKPYMHTGPLTPGSYGSNSPRTPYGGLPVNAGNDLIATPGSGGDQPIPSPLASRRPNGYGGLGDSSGYTTDPLPSPGLGVMERMGNITPGPFDHRRPSGSEAADPLRKGSLTPNAPYPDDRPSTANSNRSNRSGGSAEPYVAPKIPSRNDYEGFGPPARSYDEEAQPPPPFGGLNRSETFPRPSFTTELPSRTPSAPGTRNEASRQSQGAAAARRPSMGPDKSRRPPPRKSLIPPARVNHGSVDLAREFGVGNPYHTPSDSASSGYSAFSQPSFSSSQTSPARSQRGGQGAGGSNVDAMVDSVQQNMANLSYQDPRVNTTAPMNNQPSLVESPTDIAPVPNPYANFPDRRPSATAHATAPQPAGGVHGSPSPWGARSESLPVASNPSPTSFRPAPPSRQGTGDLPHRGDCKACRLPIQGKSISSADGRLTGKYHKACFVCASCAEPFTSAEFYVLGDKPYCEQHYHKLNGSLCGVCWRGIEGQYVEDESQIKHHVACFCCLDCGRSLSDGYFEVDGRAYCEQDAWNRVNAAPAWNNQTNYQPAQDPYGYRQAPPPGARGPPGRGPMPPRPPHGMPGLPGRPGPGGGGPRPRGVGPPMPRPPHGGPVAKRPPPSAMSNFKGGPGSRPQMNKRRTRLGMM